MTKETATLVFDEVSKLYAAKHNIVVEAKKQFDACFDGIWKEIVKELRNHIPQHERFELADIYEGGWRSLKYFDRSLEIPNGAFWPSLWSWNEELRLSLINDNKLKLLCSWSGAQDEQKAAIHAEASRLGVNRNACKHSQDKLFYVEFNAVEGAPIANIAADLYPFLTAIYDVASRHFSKT